MGKVRYGVRERERERQTDRQTDRLMTDFGKRKMEETKGTLRETQRERFV